MSYLIACLSSGKGTWASVYRLIESREWEKVIIVTNDFGKERFSNPGAHLIVIDPSAQTTALRDSLIEGLRPLLADQRGFSDVAVNLSSGSGKEHMALLSALLSLGVGLRLIEWDGELKEI